MGEKSEISKREREIVRFGGHGLLHLLHASYGTDLLWKHTAPGQARTGEYRRAHGQDRGGRERGVVL